MREIKFRGKRIDNGEWAYGYYFSITHNTGENPRHYIVPNYASAIYGIEVNPETIEQYTGFRDTNNVEIYDGDIIEFSTFDYNGADTQHIGIVYWCDGGFYIDGTHNGDEEEISSLYWVSHEDEEMEVIGNKFENPKLLEVAK